MRSLAVPSLLCVAILASCGGSNGGERAATPLSGNWQMSLQRDAASGLKTLSGFLVQSGNSVTGNMLLSGQTSCAGVGPVSGQLSGSAVTLTVDQTGQTVNLTGTTGTGISSMSGNYSILSSPCGDTSVGTWTASVVQPLNGSFQGTFTSTETIGVVFHFSGTISQAANTGASTANLSGSMTSTDASCFSSASVSGLISGTAVVLNLVSSEGVALGQYRGTAATDAGSIAGTYDIFNAAGGCDDFGNATITLQP